MKFLTQLEFHLHYKKYIFTYDWYKITRETPPLAFCGMSDVPEN